MPCLKQVKRLYQIVLFLSSAVREYRFLVAGNHWYSYAAHRCKPPTRHRPGLHPKAQGTWVLRPINKGESVLYTKRFQANSNRTILLTSAELACADDISVHSENQNLLLNLLLGRLAEKS
ncbi:MAG: hypothetical protein MUC48_15425 [Leptolyngbya sp. Prado105]|nr:hypothetical protein [Leptolyngbya sp. Prado105]